MIQTKFTKKLMVAGITLAASLAAAPSFAAHSLLSAPVVLQVFTTQQVVRFVAL